MRVQKYFQGYLVTSSLVTLPVGDMMGVPLAHSLLYLCFHFENYAPAAACKKNLIQKILWSIHIYVTLRAILSDVS